MFTWSINCKQIHISTFIGRIVEWRTCSTWILNKLIGEKVFESIVDVKSCTSEIKSSGYKKVKFKFEDEDKKKQEISFDLNLIDTPGIA